MYLLKGILYLVIIPCNIQTSCVSYQIPTWVHPTRRCFGARLVVVLSACSETTLLSSRSCLCCPSSCWATPMRLMCVISR